jgi:hypothetical protein
VSTVNPFLAFVAHFFPLYLDNVAPTIWVADTQRRDNYKDDDDDDEVEADNRV